MIFFLRTYVFRISESRTISCVTGSTEATSR